MRRLNEGESHDFSDFRIMSALVKKISEDFWMGDDPP